MPVSRHWQETFGDTLSNVHPEEKCAGTTCVVHNPGDHGMVEWPLLLREAGLVERICTHGIGHPDPDSLGFFDRIGIQGFGIHGCDGCCWANPGRTRVENIEVVDNLPDPDTNF